MTPKIWKRTSPEPRSPAQCQGRPGGTSDDPLIKGSGGSFGLLALRGVEQSATENDSHLIGPEGRKASVWVGGMKTLWKSETCNLQGSTFEDGHGVMEGGRVNWL